MKKRSFLGFFVVAMKSTKIIAVLKVLKFGKPLVTAISMLISAVAYGVWQGPLFSIGLVAMLFIHEMGHVIALRLKGYQTNGPVFIPFLGALIFAPRFDDRDIEAYVGFGGPLLGTLAALVCFAAWYFTGRTLEVLLLVSYIGVFLNLFNLIPLSPMDGGRVTQVIGPWFRWLGLGLLMVWTLLARQPQLLLIWILVMDGFSFSLWLKPVLSIMVLAAMVVLMLLGYSEQPWWMDDVDCVAATFLTASYVYRDRTAARDGETPHSDPRTYPVQVVRLKWLACYFGLVTLASVVIFEQIGYLPHMRN